MGTYAKYSGLASASSGGGVVSLDNLTGALTLSAGSGISISDNGVDTITIASTSAGDVTLAAFGSTPNANGLSLSSQVLNMQPASASFPGGVSTGTQSFAGNKTFTGTIAASNLSGTNTGDVTIGTASGLSLTGQALSLGLASAGVTGALSGTDWSTFNGKQAAGSYITALTGDATAAGPGSAALTLATVNANVGSFGSSTAIPSLTVNAKGLVTAASTSAVVAPASTLSGNTLASGVVTSSLTTVGTIGTGVWQGTKIGLAYGGTNADLSATGGTSQVLKQVTAGAAVTVGQLAFTDISGSVAAGQMPALTGDVTTSAGAVATTIAANVVSNAKLAQMATNTIKGNNTGLTANAADLTVQNVIDLIQKPPTNTIITSGSGTYTTPANCKWIRIRLAGAGGGGGGSGTSGGNGTDGGLTSFSVHSGAVIVQANGGTKGIGSGSAFAGGTGGSIPNSGNITNVAGMNGAGAGYYNSGGTSSGGLGGSTPLGSGGTGTPESAGNTAQGYGAGGGGAGSDGSAAQFPGSGGASGGYLEHQISSPAASYDYVIGAAGSGGTGTGGRAGGGGAPGVIIIVEGYV